MVEATHTICKANWSVSVRTTTTLHGISHLLRFWPMDRPVPCEPEGKSRDFEDTPSRGRRRGSPFQFARSLSQLASCTI